MSVIINVTNDETIVIDVTITIVRNYNSNCNRNSAEKGIAMLIARLIEE